MYISPDMQILAHMTRNHIRVALTRVTVMVAYFCHHLSDNYVDLSDLYVDLSVIYADLSVIYVDLSDQYVDLSEKYHHN